MKGRLVRLMDALSRGASPPGMIDIVHTRESYGHSHLRRRFTMIARYDGRVGTWSAAGLVLSVLVGGIALTGAVKGQDAAPVGVAPAPAPGTGAAPGVAAVQPEAEPATAREVHAAPGAAGAPVPQTTPGYGATPAPAAEVVDEEVDAALLAQLDRKVPEVNFDGAGLTDVIDFLRDLSGANIVVEWGHLSNAGIDRNAPVTLRVRNVKLSRALDLILSSAAAGVQVGYTVDGNIVRISTLEHLDRITDVRAYDVRDITASEVQMTDLVKLIMESVQADSWRESGGSVGVIRSTRNKLVVTQTPMNHRQIREVLRMLREEPQEPARAADAASAAQAAPVTTRPPRH